MILFNSDMMTMTSPKEKEVEEETTERAMHRLRNWNVYF